MSVKDDLLGLKDDELSDCGIEEPEESRINVIGTRNAAPRSPGSDNSDHDDAKPEEEESQEASNKPRKEVLRKQELENKMREIKKSAVVYLSSIPPYMKPTTLKHILSRFGEIGRIYLVREDIKAYSRRVKSGGNRKKKFTEGWVEFKRKSDAKLAVETLNGNPIGGKKGSYYHDDILNMKYLKRFKWTDLTEQLALEEQERQERMKAEIAQATRENNLFKTNVEQKAMLDNIQAKKGQVSAKERPSRHFEQKSSNPTKKHPKELSNVLSQVF